jgi:hypothetical protein
MNDSDWPMLAEVETFCCPEMLSIVEPPPCETMLRRVRDNLVISRIRISGSQLCACFHDTSLSRAIERIVYGLQSLRDVAWINQWPDGNENVQLMVRTFIKIRSSDEYSKQINACCIFANMSGWSWLATTFWILTFTFQPS